MKAAITLGWIVPTMGLMAAQPSLAPTVGNRTSDFETATPASDQTTVHVTRLRHTVYSAPGHMVASVELEQIAQRTTPMHAHDQLLDGSATEKVETRPKRSASLDLRSLLYRLPARDEGYRFSGPRLAFAGDVDGTDRSTYSQWKLVTLHRNAVGLTRITELSSLYWRFGAVATSGLGRGRFGSNYHVASPGDRPSSHLAVLVKHSPRESF